MQAVTVPLPGVLPFTRYRCQAALIPLQSQVEHLRGLKRKYQLSLNCGDGTDVDWLASQYPLFLHSHLRTRSDALL